MPEPVYAFWGLVALLALAAGWNHGWHHVRRQHLTSRLTRASYRDRGARMPAGQPAATSDAGMSPRP